jgi:hypothetical protein
MAWKWKRWSVPFRQSHKKLTGEIVSSLESQSNVQRVAVFGKLFSIRPNTRLGRTR